MLLSRPMMVFGRAAIMLTGTLCLSHYLKGAKATDKVLLGSKRTISLCQMASGCSCVSGNDRTDDRKSREKKAARGQKA